MTVVRCACVVVTAMLVGASPPAWAQSPPPLDWTSLIWSVPHSDPEVDPMDAPVTRIAHGDFNGDRIRDAVMIVGDKLVFVSAPDVHRSFIVLNASVPANDVATLPGEGPGGIDAFVTIGATGLFEWKLDVSDPAAPVILATQIMTGIFAGGTHVRVANVSGNGNEIIAIGNDHRAIVRVYRNSGAWDEQLVATNADDVIDLELLDWGSAPALDIAVLSASVLRVYALASGSVLQSITPTNSVALEYMTRVRHKARGRDQIALVWVASTGTECLCVYGAGLSELPFNFGPAEIAGIAAADLDADGDSELCVSHRYSFEQVVLRSVSTSEDANSPSYSYAEVYTFAVSDEPTSMAENDVEPALADFDGDGDIDILFPCRPTRSIVVARLQRVQEYGYRVQPTASAGSPTPSVSVYNYTSHSVLDIGFSRPVLGLSPETATHVEVLVWHRKYVNGFLEVEPIVHQRFEIPTSWNAAPPPSTYDTINASIETPGTFGPMHGDGLFLQVRTIRVSETTPWEYLEVGPTNTILVTPLDEELAFHDGEANARYGMAVAPPALWFPNYQLSTAAAPPPEDPVEDSDPPSGDVDDPNPNVIVADGIGGGTGVKKGPVETGGVSPILNLDPFDPDAPPVVPIRPPMTSGQ